MPDTFNIPENVVEAFYREFWASADIGEPEDRNFEAGIQACLKEWGAREECRAPVFLAYMPTRTQRRLVLPWEPVEGDES